MSNIKKTLLTWLVKLFLPVVLDILRAMLVKAIEVIDRIKQRKNNPGGDKVNHGKED